MIKQTKKCISNDCPIELEWAWVNFKIVSRNLPWITARVYGSHVISLHYSVGGTRIALTKTNQLCKQLGQKSSRSISPVGLWVHRDGRDRASNWILDTLPAKLNDSIPWTSSPSSASECLSTKGELRFVLLGRLFVFCWSIFDTTCANIWVTQDMWRERVW